MSDENYKKCKSCRFCIHSESSWICHFTGGDSGPEGTCARYRPGICESCVYYSADGGKEMCGALSRETMGLDVCSLYEPHYRSG